MVQSVPTPLKIRSILPQLINKNEWMKNGGMNKNQSINTNEQVKIIVIIRLNI